MELLDFTMPPFARIQWASKVIKDKYEPMFEKAKRVYGILEKESVKHGIRHVTTDSVTADNFDFVQKEYIKNGLIFLPLRKVGTYNGFSNYHPPVVNGQPWHYYGVVADSIEYAEQFAHAESINDHATMGKLLGYPECCIDMLNNVWAKGYVDPIFQQAQNSSNEIKKTETDNLIVIKGHDWESNSLLRPFNIGTIFHIKDRIDCPHTLKIARDWIKLGQELNIDGLREMEMFQRMPMEWDALKGIAIIKTPLFKASINSVTCTEKHQVRLEGTFYPEDAPNGIHFPWRTEDKFATIARNGNSLDN
jgi:hypothetical protein